MKKVDQTVVDKGIGNCMQAVLASLFEKSLVETVNVMDYPEGKWAIPFMEWVESVGYEYVGTMDPADTTEETCRDLRSLYAVDGYFYASVPSRNFKDVSHAVIIDRSGVVVHDPNPKKQWLGENVVTSEDLNHWYLFEPSMKKARG